METSEKKKPNTKKAQMRLFVWEDFDPSYTSGGLAFAIARDEADARKQIINQHGNPYDWGTLTVYSISKRIAKCVSGGG